MPNHPPQRVRQCVHSGYKNVASLTNTRKEGANKNTYFFTFDRIEKSRDRLNLVNIWLVVP